MKVGFEFSLKKLDGSCQVCRKIAKGKGEGGGDVIWVREGNDEDIWEEYFLWF